MNDDMRQLQESVCAKFGVTPSPSSDEQKLGISYTVRERKLPINGMRIPPSGDSTGWYIWAGEDFSEDPNFFVPLHVVHLKNWCIEALPFLNLPAGWRFLVAGDQVDVWFDEHLLTGHLAD